MTQKNQPPANPVRFTDSPHAAGHHPRLARLANGLSFREVGLHQCPTEKNSQGVTARGQRVPSHVPNPHADRRGCRAFGLQRRQFTTETDSPLEGDGFEPSVPRDRPALSNTPKPNECRYFRRSDRHSGVRTWPIATGNRWFESISLQQTVRLSRDLSFLYRKAGSCRGVRGPGQSARPAETRRARQDHANCR